MVRQEIEDQMHKKDKRNPKTTVQRNSRCTLCSKAREQVYIGAGECKALGRMSPKGGKLLIYQMCPILLRVDTCF